MNIFLLVVLAVIGMGMALVGFFQLSGEGMTVGSRLAGWGLSVCVAALATGLRVLQKQIDELKSGTGTPATDSNANPKD